MSKLKKPSISAVRRQMKPYALAIGELTLAWNQLQERLAMLFWNAINIPHGDVALSMWNIVRSDMVQRELLKAAVKSGAFNDRFNGQQAEADILWLLEKVAILSQRRNDAIHAPLALTLNSEGKKIEPHVALGNPRAKGLSNKDLMKELIWYRETSFTLSIFAGAMHECLSRPKIKLPWPGRPLLPSLGARTK
jgi:hypothetical protein